MGAERIIAMSRHESRQKLAREFGATDIVTERGDEGVERIKQLTNGICADSVLECVGTQQSMMQAIPSFYTLAHSCAANVPVSTLEAIARTESALYPYALSINRPHQLAHRQG